MPEMTGERVLRGIGVSPGVCHGKLLVLGRSSPCIPTHRISEVEVESEMCRLEQALIKTRHELIEVQNRVREGMGAEDAGIFDAHLLVLEDRTLIDEVSRLVHEQHLNVEQAFHDVAEKYAATLGAIEDDYLRERASDMRDVTQRILNNLAHRDGDLLHLAEPAIIIGFDLAPSTTAMLDRTKVLGFGTDIGSRTSHTAIMARSLRIPALVGLHDASQHLKTGTYALLDGFNGYLIINPTDQTLFEYGQIVRRRVGLEEKFQGLQKLPAITLDGVRICLSANVEQAADTEVVKQGGAEGVGLFRTEFLFINRSTYPTEEEQFEAYKKVASALNPEPVVIRTLDLGGDKFLSHLPVPAEMNPFLGWRAIRFCLEEHAVFRNQLRAILRASAFGNVKMMYPMISCVDELDKANAMVEECKAELRAEGVAFQEDIEIGVMIEIPSAALIADALGKRSKFFSIGTNDLVQYSLAVDRVNEKIAHLYEPSHPAILRLIQMTVQAGHRNDIWVGVCGEVAGDPALVPLLLGLGVDELSVAPPMVPQIKYLIRNLRMSDARKLAEFALTCESGSEVLARSEEVAMKAAPVLFERYLRG